MRTDTSIQNAHAVIDRLAAAARYWEHKARDAEEGYNTLLQTHDRLEDEFDDVAANAQWVADIVRSHLSHLPEAREALDASPGVSVARLRDEIRAEVENEINGPIQMGEPVLPKPPTLSEQALRMCYRIERAGASPELTEASVLANELLKVLRHQAEEARRDDD